MSPLGIVAILQIGGGVVGCIFCIPSSSGIKLPEAWIDDPVRILRYISR